MLPHLGAAYNLARYLTNDASVAEDIVQEAFLRAFKAFDTYRDGSARAWLFSILRNCWRDRAAEQARRDRVVISDGGLSEAQTLAVAATRDEADTPEEFVARAREIDVMRDMIAGLPEPFRETLVLREMEELSYREIAVVTGVPIGTVMSRLARAREMLAKLLLPADGASLQERSA
ncbi:MAG: sigma-70 family RNA polymerase sigma factor [Proteobacteria bacterium]|nr:sigma-70 family RNA polymerase sigma factor [Pseudomonadota bacterium]